MSTEQTRHDVLGRAVGMLAGVETASFSDVFTDDVTVTTPVTSISTLSELVVELELREVAFADLRVDLTQSDVVGDQGYAEWVATATHVAPLVIDDDLAIEPVDGGLTLHGVTVATFSGDLISSMRQYWDELELLDGLGLVPTG